ncbi:RNA pseudouridine synthase [Arcobacter venerupis]|uniref:RNA pseudouridylate synthase n=1 Tax=Arcobacter venerupis TaxID=1054033 RepID=A0AAE7B8N4_9BACT|nr:RluA family pseudouridine synthase [Arcobacter venerupis]QKF67468.1 RNA pseudouridine synthase [Arcobacter venerupis]RWS50517.1 RNA pseudouridine synthase [Arcobacter venerupis]
MPYIKKEFKTIKGKKIEEFLQTLAIDLKLCLTLLEKGKITDENNKRLQKNQIIKSDFIYIVIFEPQTKGLKPIFDSFHFAIFDKPSGIMVHPSSHQLNIYTLLDEIKYHFGEKASLVHRIDAETSGLVLVAKNAFSDMVLKSMFEEKLYTKKYKALVDGEIKEELTINTAITNDTGLIKLKMKTDINGKESTTIIKPILYDEINNQTLIEAIPLTGRQHQIRVHLDSIGHTIIGDPLYGVNEKFADDFLKNNISLEKRVKITKAPRLMLQADYLEFEFLDVIYKFSSKQKFITI